MCGIAGYFAPQKKYENELQGMTNALRHRGPDADGFFFDDTVGLGHRRLSIIDLSKEANQPMFSADGRYVIIFNGELFNFRDVAKELSISLRTHSDTEVMIEAFARQGPAAINLFNGMFAIAIYDMKEKVMHLIRDRAGVKPLFYVEQNKEFFFASEIKALMQVEHLRSSFTVNHRALSLYLQLGYIPEPMTIWNEMKKFPSGHCMSINSSGSSMNCYWKAEDQLTQMPMGDIQTAKKKFHELLESSVAYRMISDVPFGTFLSGGIDSTLVTAIAQSNSSIPVKTFTIGFHEQGYDEAGHAKKIAKHLGTDHHEFYITHRDALDQIEPMMDCYDEPFADSSGLPTMLLSKWTRQHVKMVLTGDGGDELFMGYGSYRWAQRLKNPLTKFFRSPLANVLSQFGERYQRAAKLFEYENEETMPVHIFSQEQYFFSGKEARQLLQNKFTDERNLFSFNQTHARKLSAPELQALFDLNFYLKDDLLVKVDRASMRHSLECRTPLLDYRIIAFALNVKEQLKMKNNNLKMLPRILLADLIPKKLFERPKRGFSVPLQHWLKNELRYLIENYLSDEMILKHQTVDPDSVQRLKKQFFGGTNYLYNRLWNLVVLHRWLEQNSTH